MQQKEILMESVDGNRREFLQTAAAAGVVALCASNMFDGFAAPALAKPKKTIYVCQICGHLEFGAPPAVCPMCRSSKEKFETDDSIFAESENKFKSLSETHSPELVVTKKSQLVTEEPSISVQIKIGHRIHASTEEHHIRFIDCYIDDAYFGCLLPKTNSHPAAVLEIRAQGSVVRVVSRCTLHGYWQKEAAVV
jgi:desulfoferrodoxin (superoxide reductase-like protein)